MTLKKYVFLFIAMWVAWGTTTAQQPAPAQLPSPAEQQKPGGPKTDSQGDSKTEKVPTVRVRTDEVNVVFTVVDKDGKFVRDLKQDQFRILDNKMPPRQMMNFAAQTDLPLHVGLLIDASNSIRDRFQFEKDAASEFLYEIIRPKADRAFVLAFDETWDVTQDFTGDIDKLRTGIRGI
jgi:Ca-activated chloride channel family protein